ncbi:MAG: AAA family ATPase [Ramlibacter sp.]|nr:AAA family ATPase [Ramlibacter sp.]
MTTNPAGSRFCEHCGHSLQLSCGRCGHDVNPTARFCGNCGHGLAASTAVAGAELARWGELKQATVLFADVVSSTELIAEMDPEQAMGRLRPAVLRMRHSVERFGGTVVRTLGDGVMALFGVPQALEGHALLACQAALHMQETFAAGGDGLAIRVGLHSGEVASDPQDAEDGRGGGAHGLTIHIASRVVTLADPGAICLTETCWIAAGSGCETKPMGPRALKGIREAVVIHELRSLQARSAERGGGAVSSSSFRGRDVEVSRLERALAEARDGNSRAVGISGEPGAGKSRLSAEFAARCREGGTAVHEVRAQLYGNALPLQPILELFRTHFFGIAPGDDSATARERIAIHFAALALSKDDLGTLYEFFGVAHEVVMGTLSPRARQSKLLAMLRELLRAEAHIHRVILIEDVHWLDEGSEEFVSLLVNAVAGTHTMLLLNYRTSYRCPWVQLPHFEQLDLSELPAGEMELLVDELFASVSATPEVRHLVCRRARGNPFFAEELVHMLTETKLILTETGLPVGGLEAVERSLPATVQAVVGARLDRIGEPEKTLLQMCAIIGEEIPLAVLQHVASPLAAHIERGLEGLCRAGLILPHPGEGPRHFAFRHPLIQEVAYGSQLKVRRSQVHATVAEAMEIYYQDRLEEFAGLVAYHYEFAQRHGEAARYMARAARWVAATHSARGIQAWRKVHSLLDHCIRSAEIDSLRAFASGRILYLGWREGVLSDEEVQRLGEEAITLANDADYRLVQLLLFAQGRLVQATGGRADDYVDALRRAMEMSPNGLDAGRHATLCLALSHAYTWAGMLGDALHCSDEALKGLAEIDELDRDFIGFSVENWAWGIRVRLLNKLGHFEQAREWLDKLIANCEATADPVMRQLAHFAGVDHAWCCNDADLAARHTREVVQFAEGDASPYAKILGHASRAIALHVARDFEQARGRYLAALELVRSGRVALDFEPELMAGLAECQLELGELPAAAETAGESVAMSRRLTNRVAECRALITLAHATAASGKMDEGATVLIQAESLLATTGARVFQPAFERARAACTATAVSTPQFHA